MGLFGRRKGVKKDDSGSTLEGSDAQSLKAEETDREEAGEKKKDSSSLEYSREAGPFDSSEDFPEGEYLDVGSIRFPVPEGAQVRLEVDQSTDTIVAVTVDLGTSSLQLQAFAAPKTSTIWEEIRDQIRSSVKEQGGSSEILSGQFGEELFVKLPVQSQEGSMGYRSARFLGVDGPRWFLRGVLGGSATTDERQAEPLMELFRSCVVSRGEQALPPKELLPLNAPMQGGS